MMTGYNTPSAVLDHVVRPTFADETFVFLTIDEFVLGGFSTAVMVLALRFHAAVQ